MEGSLSDEQVHRWLQEIADNAWLSLHFESPAMGGSSLGEIGGGGYLRQQVGWSQPNNRHIWTIDDARFTGLLPNRVTHFGVWSSKKLGDPNGFLRGYGELPSPTSIASGGGFVLHAGDVAISLG